MPSFPSKVYFVRSENFWSRELSTMDSHASSVMELPFAMPMKHSEATLDAPPNRRDEETRQQPPDDASPGNSSATAVVTSSLSNNAVPDLSSTMSASEEESNSPESHSLDQSHLLDAAASLWRPDSSLARQMEHATTLPFHHDDPLTPDPTQRTERIPRLEGRHEPTQREMAPSLILSEHAVSMAPSTIVPQQFASWAGVSVHQVSDDSFEAAVSLSQDPQIFLSSVNAWRHWCEAICHPIIVLSESNTDARDRQYEGIWTEATVGRLKSPNPWDLIDVYDLCGCPTFGRLSLFVQNDIISATLGPFAGNSEQRYKFTRTRLPNGRFRLHVTVRIANDRSRCSFTRPSISQHRDQVVTSLARLRFWVEDEETSNAVVMETDSLGTPLLRQQP